MIRKFFIAFLAVWYLGISSGATLHYQYCMGRLIKVSLWHDHAPRCSTCGMYLKDKAAKKCCTDKHQQLKSEKGRALTGNDLHLTVAEALPAAGFRYRPATYYVPLITAFPVSQSPPATRSVPVFLFNCNFRI